MVAHSLVKDAAKKLGIAEMDVITVSAISGTILHDPKPAQMGYVNRNNIPDWVEDFCLKALLGKIPIIGEPK
jgi:hypothetical protein